MCSLCGIATKLEPENARENLEIVLRMLDATRHRGPDGAGVFLNGKVHHGESVRSLDTTIHGPDASARVVVGQSRLAITGSRGLKGQQPFRSRHGDLTLTHNGEVYNHRSLAAGLETGAESASGSDSEVLMRVLEHHVHDAGQNLPEAVRRTVGSLSGMYALAASDGETVVLARDAVGKKPLYFVAGAARFAWASERKALAEVARREGAPIRTVKPGSMIVCGADLGVSEELVERLSLPAIDLVTMPEAVAAYRRALEDAVAARTAGLEKAAVLFSGGIDSVVVARLLQRAGIHVTGYVSGVAGSSDVEHAVRMSRQLGLDVKVSAVDEDAIEAWLPTILHHTELHGPLMAEVSIPMWFASKAAHEDGHRVIFTGQAADELFGGYSWYASLLADTGPLTLHARMWEDVQRLPTDTLEREDRITMAWSLEMRAPFLDAEVIRTAFRIDPRLKVDGSDDAQRKHPHRRLAVLLGIPREIAYRRKEPAQDGADVHGLLHRVALRRYADRHPPTRPVPDFGSNYRYRDTPGRYQSAPVYAMLADIARRERILVADQDGTAVPPPEIPGPRLESPASGAAGTGTALS